MNIESAQTESQETHDDFLNLKRDINHYLQRCHSANEALHKQIQDLEIVRAPWPEGLAEKEQALSAATNELLQLNTEMEKNRTAFEGMKYTREQFQKMVALVVDAKAI